MALRGIDVTMAFSYNTVRSVSATIALLLLLDAALNYVIIQRVPCTCKVKRNEMKSNFCVIQCDGETSRNEGKRPRG